MSSQGIRSQKQRTSARSIGFCVIWVCIISSSSSKQRTEHVESIPKRHLYIAPSFFTTKGLLEPEIARLTFEVMLESWKVVYFRYTRKGEGRQIFQKFGKIKSRILY